MTAIVTLVMLVVYVTILLLILRRASAVPRDLAATIVLLGLALGAISYLVITLLNNCETYFINTRGPSHIFLVGPTQEEIMKFVGFLLAYHIILRLQALSKPVFSSMGNGRKFATLAASVGLALAMLENLNDYGYLTVEDTLIRTITSWPLHMMTVAVSAYGFSRYRTTGKIAIALGALFLAVAIHIAFNLIAFLYGR